MDKNIIKKYLNKTFVTESTGTPAIKLAGQLAKDNKKINKAGIEAIDKDVKGSDKAAKTDPNEKTMTQNKFNYIDDSEKKYHDEMETMNGQEMIQYDRTPDERFKERALEAIEGSTRMGNNPEWANVVAKGQGGDPEFGKKLAKRIKSSIKKKSEQTPTTKMYGDDWEVVPDKGHKPYAIEEGKIINTLEKNKNKSQIKESMKRLKFKKEFNGLGNALKLIPEAYKVEDKVFEMTDGNESYKIRWEGTLNEGKAIVLIASDKTMVNEDIQKMKHLMKYKSEDTLGSVKGKARLDEDKAFSDGLAKTRKIMETEDIEDQDVAEGPFEEANVKYAPEAKKDIEGTTSTDKGTQAPAPKEGHWDKIKTTQASEAKKDIEGATSTDKGTQAPKPKEGDWDKVGKGHANEAKTPLKSNKSTDKGTQAPKPKEGHWSDAKKATETSDKGTQAPKPKEGPWEKIKKASGTTDKGTQAPKPKEGDWDDVKKKVVEGHIKENDDDGADAPIKKRADAYDATLDVADPEDMANKISKSDIDIATKAPSVINKDMDDSGDDEIDTDFDDSEVKIVSSKSRPGVYGLMTRIDGRIVGVEDVPPEYLELAKRHPKVALAKIKAQKETSDEELMEEIDKHFGINRK